MFSRVLNTPLPTYFRKILHLRCLPSSEYASELNRPSKYFRKLVPVNEFIFQLICRLEPATLLKMIFFLQVILKNFTKLLVNSHKHLLDIRYLNGLWEFFQTLSKTFAVGWVLYQGRIQEPCHMWHESLWNNGSGLSDMVLDVRYSISMFIVVNTEIMQANETQGKVGTKRHGGL